MSGLSGEGEQYDVVDVPGRLVVVGASLAGLRAAETARRSGFRGEILLIGQESHLPYDRPPLSKGFLADPETVVAYHPIEVLREDLDVQLLLGRRATGLDTFARTVTVDDGSTLQYDRLVIATGVTVRRPGDWSDLQGMHTLRTLDDALLIRQGIVPGARVVVVGGGLIGSEVASTALSLSAVVTIVEAAEVPMVRAVGAVVGQRLVDLHRANGTRVICGQQVIGLEGEGRVGAVLLSSGERIPADVVVVGIGADPATAWLRDSGLALSETDGAVLCNEYLETSAPGVYAAGDVVDWPNRAMGRRMRLENWTNAVEQGMTAGRNAVVAPRGRPHESVPYFWSDWYGHRLQFVGTPDAGEVVIHDRPAGEAPGFVALFVEDGRLVGVAGLNAQRLIMKYRRMIAKGSTYPEALELLGPIASPASVV